MPPLPCSPYAATKLAASTPCELVSQCRPDTAVLRYFNIFGPARTKSYAAGIAAFAKVFTPPPRHDLGDGGQSRDFTYVDNVSIANLCRKPMPNRSKAKYQSRRRRPHRSE
jgi:nucleoside-diphosphate-sugar epimerase